MSLLLPFLAVPGLDKMVWLNPVFPPCLFWSVQGLGFSPREERIKGRRKYVGWMQFAAGAWFYNEVELVPQPWWLGRQLMSYTNTDPAEWCLGDLLPLCLKHTHTHIFILTCCLLELTPLPTFTNGPASRETKKRKEITKHLWLVCSCQRDKFVGKRWIEGPLFGILALSKARQCDVSPQGLWVQMCVCMHGVHSKNYIAPEE